MKIAIFDYSVVRSNPSGSCHRTLISALAEEHEFTVFARAFDNPCPSRISWVSVPSIRRPLAALFITFHISALVRYLQMRIRRAGFSAIQGVESNLGFGDIVYSHFCHRWFLKHRWKYCRQTGLRGFLRWLDHFLHAMIEPWSLRRARWVIAPSHGVARELRQEYPFTDTKIHIIPNPVDLISFSRPAAFDRAPLRHALDIEDSDLVIVFVALGQFERKGLPALLEALSAIGDCGWKLVVVGGTEDLIRAYTQRVTRLGLERRVRFAGHQEDIRPFLWLADLFALPSKYEVFPLAVLQAAAAGCPLLITGMNGADEFLKDGESCLLTESNADAIRKSLNTLRGLSIEERQALGSAACKAVQQFSTECFTSAWREFYARIEESSLQ